MPATRRSPSIFCARSPECGRASGCSSWAPRAASAAWACRSPSASAPASSRAREARRVSKQRVDTARITESTIATRILARVREITDGRGVGVVFENLGDADLFAKAFGAIGRNGRLVTAGAHAGRHVPLDLAHLYLNYITIVRLDGSDRRGCRGKLGRGRGGRSQRRYRPDFPLEEAAAAHELAASRTGIGKIILRPDSAEGL